MVMRMILFIIIHCSAVRPSQRSTAKDIDRWHRERGWDMIGYHYVVRRDGSIERGRPLEMAGAHCRNHNSHSVGICYEGGLDADGRPADTRMEAQKESLRKLLLRLKGEYPTARIMGHHDFDRMKECPCFDAEHEYEDIQ